MCSCRAGGAEPAVELPGGAPSPRPDPQSGAGGVAGETGGLWEPGPARAGVRRAARGPEGRLGLSFSRVCWHKARGFCGQRGKGARVHLLRGVVCSRSINKCVIVNVQTHQSNNNGMKSKDYQSLLVTAE